MYFVLIESTPQKGTNDESKYGGAYVTCWVNEKNQVAARKTASQAILNNGWVPGKILEEKNFGKQGDCLDRQGKKYFAQALIQGVVCVFHLYPPQRGKTKRKRT